MNTLEVLGELHGLVPYALSSSHSVTAGNQALFVEAMAKVPTQGVATAISKFCGDLLEYQRKNYLYLKNNGYNTDGNEHYDYNLTDISKLDAAFAALKKVTDFLVKQDVSNVDAYIKAACSCYQFYMLSTTEMSGHIPGWTRTTSLISQKTSSGLVTLHGWRGQIITRKPILTRIQAGAAGSPRTPVYHAAIRHSMMRTTMSGT